MELDPFIIEARRLLKERDIQGAVEAYERRIRELEVALARAQGEISGLKARPVDHSVKLKAPFSAKTYMLLILGMLVAWALILILLFNFGT